MPPASNQIVSHHLSTKAASLRDALAHLVTGPDAEGITSLKKRVNLQSDPEGVARIRVSFKIL